MTNDVKQWPVHEINLVLQACNPAEPLEPGDERYADFDTLRQEVGIAQMNYDLLSPLVEGKFHHNCFCGHRGSGKSTELLSLKKWADEQGFLTALTEVDEHFVAIENAKDEDALAFSDLFLLAATVAEQAMKEFGHPLPGDKIRRVVEWFDERIKEDKENVQSEIAMEAGAQLGGAIPSLGKLFAKFTTGIKGSSSHALTTRRTIRRYPNELIDLTNDLLSEANKILARHGKPRGLLLLFDNLDRYEPKQIDNVLFRGSDLVGRMQCHALFTIPISLEYEPLSGAPRDCYGFSIVLPMLRVRRKHQDWKATIADTAYDEEAIKMMRDALALRLDLNLFENPADVDLILRTSGGCMRDVMHLVTLAFRHARGTPHFTSAAVKKAITQMRASYIRKLSPTDYAYLAAIARREAAPLTDEGEEQLKEKRRLLFQRFALEYLDDEGLPWMDVHPIVIETEEFRRAYHQTSTIANA
jgi:hypothetical protein